ncbi:peroxidase 63-like [Macadamia integrifolia]|uniref:peroxidase 63-like n=1 Tax=Macadamia integrifolia TaxID=60698 RepID=UPI001C4E97D2|nr:peroxidase 63-like [Macadamia integrifolia]
MTMAAAAALPLLILLFISISLKQSESKLNINYYQKTCPQMEKTIQDIVTTKQINSPTTAAATLRLLTHDCLVEGCDASILITSTPSNKAERDHDLNLSLAGDAFDVVVRGKTALELACPGIVSCADILALTTRDLVTMVGGPHYEVRLGRKDSLVSLATNVDGNILASTATVSQQIDLFASKGFSVQEMVALLGAHTIGFAHCKEFASRIFNFSKNSQTDPSLNPRFAVGLRNACANYEKNPTMAVFFDVITPGKFDNMFFQNMPRGMTLLKSDNYLVQDPRTRPFVMKYASDQATFFSDFAHAMEKLSILHVKTGHQGEVRRKCDSFNNVKV